MNWLYHGSAAADIRILQPPPSPQYVGEPGVYLSGNLPYALFYIWDREKLGTARKHVTAGIRGGMVYYEEQFDRQTEAFYRGVSGWIYHIHPPKNIRPVENREEMYLCPGQVPVDRGERIPDVYAALLQWEKAGKLTIRRFDRQTEERRAALTGRIAQVIREAGFYAKDPNQAGFFRRYFSAAWEQAKELGPV